MKEKMDDDFKPITINTKNINVNIITTLKTDKIEINLNKNNDNNDNIPIGPRMKHQKRNKKEDIELQIACEDEQEKKERLFQEKLKMKEIKLKNKNLIYKIDEDNYNCVDCGTPQANYISINNGVTLCDNCAEIHKKFGQKISFLLNINDELDEYLFNFIVFGSNTKFKRFLEKENVDKNLNPKRKYKTNAVVFYRKSLKNKVEGKKKYIDQKHNLIFFKTRDKNQFLNLEISKLGKNRFAETSEDNLGDWNSTTCNGCRGSLKRGQERYVCLHCRKGRRLRGGFVDYCSDCIKKMCKNKSDMVNLQEKANEVLDNWENDFMEGFIFKVEHNHENHIYLMMPFSIRHGEDRDYYFF